MVTKIKPRRMNTSGPWSLWKDLAYQTEVVFDWAEGWSWVGDMRYSDFNFQDLTDSTVVLDLRTEVTPTWNFVVTAPTTIKDWQYYILRVNNWAIAYSMTFTWNITNPHSVPLTLTANSIDQFTFLAIWWYLELLPEATGWAIWGQITGTLSNQVDLQNALDLKANDNSVVHNTWNESVAWTKTFSTSPVVPNKTTDATNTGTAIATEAQVYKKQDTLTQGAWISISNNTISNTWVISVNWNNWAVSVNDIKIAALAPIWTEWMVWYDTTNDKLMMYDGVSWKDVNTQVIVEDNLTSTSTTNALSANQWRILDWKIADLMALWKFLSLWDATTGQPISFPYTTPYTYSTWDYFLVETISSATPPVNYRPDWSSYTWTASSTPETDELEQGDVYIYDWSIWLLQSNHWKTVSFANIAWDPYDNTNLAAALWDKQDLLTAWANITIDPVTNEISASNTTYSSATSSVAWIVKLWSDTAISEAFQTPSTATNKTYPVQLNASGQMWVNVPRANTTYWAWTWINIDANNDIQNTWVTSFNWSTWAITWVGSVNWNTWAVTVNDVKVSASAPASPTEWMAWYDTTNDQLKVYDGSNWNEANVNTKIFTLSSLSDTINWQAAINRVETGKEAIIKYNNNFYYLNKKSTTILTTYLYFFSTQRALQNGWIEASTLLIVCDDNYQIDNISEYGGTIIWVPTVWTNWQILTVVSWAAAWANAPATWIQNDTTWTTTTVTKIWAWTEVEYNALSSHDTNTIYHIY